MFHCDGPSRIFGSRVLDVDDNFDLLDREKSILKTPDHEVLSGEQLGRHVDGMARGHGHNCVPAGACNSSHWLKIGQWPKSRLTFFELGMQHVAPDTRLHSSVLFRP
jgi:hypothetical protein